MGSIELTLREHLSQGAKNSAERLSEIQTFREKIEENSLNLKVHEALTLRKQGHLDKAILNISEANRDQVLAIRNIQRLMGQFRGEQYPEVVFEKFRQFEPFEIGISDADAVLSILADLDNEDDRQLGKYRLKLHDCELRKKDEEDYLSFLEGRLNQGSASEEVDKTRKNAVSLAHELAQHRNRILKKILVVVSEALKELPSGAEKDRFLLELSRNMFLVVTSPILTKPATQVETER